MISYIIYSNKANQDALNQLPRCHLVWVSTALYIHIRSIMNTHCVLNVKRWFTTSYINSAVCERVRKLRASYVRTFSCISSDSLLRGDTHASLLHYQKVTLDHSDNSSQTVSRLSLAFHRDETSLQWTSRERVLLCAEIFGVCLDDWRTSFHGLGTDACCLSNENQRPMANDVLKFFL